MHQRAAHLLELLQLLVVSLVHNLDCDVLHASSHRLVHLCRMTSPFATVSALHKLGFY